MVLPQAWIKIQIQWKQKSITEYHVYSTWVHDQSNIIMIEILVQYYALYGRMLHIILLFEVIQIHPIPLHPIYRDTGRLVTSMDYDKY